MYYRALQTYVIREGIIIDNVSYVKYHVMILKCGNKYILKSEYPNLNIYCSVVNFFNVYYKFSNCYENCKNVF